MADNMAVQTALDAITVVDETAAKLPASSAANDTAKSAQVPESMQMDESNVDTRSKPRTLAIVAALYMVLFIAALDQTIIA
jgi:hypothetical protein